MEVYFKTFVEGVTIATLGVMLQTMLLSLVVNFYSAFGSAILIYPSTNVWCHAADHVIQFSGELLFGFSEAQSRYTLP